MTPEALNSLILAELPAAQRGDREAFGRIVAGCQGGISAIALAMVRDVAASEDIAQDAFLNAWTKLDRLRNPSSFLPWLRQITRNLARDHLRAKRGDHTSADFDLILQTVADPTPDHADQLARQQEEQIVADLIDELPEETREILLIYYREGQSSKQVAQLLGMQDAAVRKRLQRARDSLRSDLLDRLGAFARATAPTAAFTALVIGCLTVSTPAAAAGFASGAAVAGKGLSKLFAGFGLVGKLAPKAASGAGFAAKSAPKFLVGAMGGVVFALVFGIAAIVFGVRRHWITAIDDEEKRQLRNFAAVGIATVLAFCGLMTVAVLQESAYLPTLAFVGLMAAIGAANLWWLPRILARRHALEAMVNPRLAARHRRTERRNAWVGMVLGIVLGGSGLIFGLLSSGRL